MTLPAPASLLSGRFFRIIFAADSPRLLVGARSPEGRFHHDGQSALYMSPNPAAAAFAVAAYLRPDDPPRLIVPLAVTDARLADLRDPATQSALGLSGSEASVLWQPERVAGLPATSWRASDAARASGADGMIYAARSNPARWHVVLFRWNVPGAAQVREDGPATDYLP